ncbi:MAG: Fe-S cluster assembly protein SufE [Gammaproteobacteria bacterium TMED30]|jgi:cysteine desulfuration protein SufE|nr:MAG: Fe-S cluster assembly protein SufE [Gammaproteobacteria bacterium TMED30]|tara:strand:- start:357 stop:758 length:402 start_codon:yes stop_codon:yes gene_type:complete
MDVQALKDTFEFFDDWEDKYRFVIDLGKDLPSLSESERIDENIIRGCQSQVWLVHEIKENTLHFAMDSDAHIVRGLISIVLIALNNRSANDILATDIEALFEELQLLSHLSATRGNGLRAMIQRIQQIAAAAI